MTIDPFASLIRHDSYVDVDIHREYRTDARDLWDAITNPDRIGRWMAPVSGDFRVGGRFRVDFDISDPAQQVHGSIIRCDAPNRLDITWEIFEAGTSDVVAILHDTDNGCELHLRHTSLPESMGAGYAAGWHAYCDALEALLLNKELRVWDDRWAEVFPEYQRRLS